MNAEKIMDAMGKIDDKYIEENAAIELEKTDKNHFLERRKKTFSLRLCACLAAAFLFIWFGIFQSQAILRLPSKGISALTSGSKKGDWEKIIIGNWDADFACDFLGPQENPEKIVLATHHIQFRKDGKGLWKTSFQNEAPDAQRTFTYQIKDGKITLQFENGSQETYPFTIRENGKELILKIKRNDLKFKKK